MGDAKPRPPWDECFLLSPAGREESEAVLEVNTGSFGAFSLGDLCFIGKENVSSWNKALFLRR